MKFPKTLISMAALAVFQPAFAATQDDDGIVVTANRTAQTTDDVIASVSVITREDIEATQAQDVMELLRLQAGIDVARNGGSGTTTSVFMRGTSNKQILVLIDGVKASSATLGTFAWEQLSPDQIERIEIVRGPHASVYGTDAIGGVIQIFTRKSKQDSIAVSAGSYDTKKYTVSMANSGEKGRSYLTMSSTSSEGFSATNNNNANYNADNDGYQALSLSTGVERDISDRTQIKASAWFNNGRSEFDAYLAPNAYSYNTNATVSLSATTQISDKLTQTLSLGQAVDHATTISNYPSDIKTDRNTFTWQNEWQHSDSAYSVYGLDYTADHAVNVDTTAATTPVFDENINDTGAFWLLNKQAGSHTFELSGRVDQHNVYGQHTTGSFGYAKQFGDSVRVRLNYGTGFRSPTINELYYPGYGNPALLPETSSSTELGITHTLSARSSYSLNFFLNDVINQIEAPAPAYTAVNIGHARTPGMEFSFKTNSAKWKNSFNITVQDPRDVDTDKLLIRRAPQTVSLHNIRRLSNGGSFNSEIIWAAAREDGSNTLEAYTLWNIAMRYPVSKNGILTGRIENLLDTQYEYVYGYNTPGRSYYLGVDYSF